MALFWSTGASGGRGRKRDTEGDVDVDEEHAEEEEIREEKKEKAKKPKVKNEPGSQATQLAQRSPSASSIPLVKLFFKGDIPPWGTVSPNDFLVTWWDPALSHPPLGKLVVGLRVVKTDDPVVKNKLALDTAAWTSCGSGGRARGGPGAQLRADHTHCNAGHQFLAFPRQGGLRVG